MEQKSNPAAEAARISLETLKKVLSDGKNFIFEAGAGAGKTYSLIKALNFLIDRDGKTLLKEHKRIACITYTNVAKNEIDHRTDKHPVVHSDTIHAFCWSIIRNFQQELRKILPGLGNWEGRIREYHESVSSEIGSEDNSPIEVPEIDFIKVLGKKEVIYQLGYPSINDYQITLYHDDVLNLMVQLLEKEKFRKIIFSKYPVILIDEYQDTYAPFADALQRHFITPEMGPQIGFFGDNWQKIYGNGCGKIENEKLVFIPKNANFRSVITIVNFLNQMRPKLIQEVEDPNAIGSAKIYHTNNWIGVRRTGAHWAGDLPTADAHEYLEFLRRKLENEGWDFRPEKTKILMLTHNILADEQGYRKLADVFSNNEAYIKKEDKYIAFFIDYLEPLCEAYSAKKFGEMFSILGSGKNGISSHSDKLSWSEVMKGLNELRTSGTIGDVIDYLLKKSKPKLPESIEIAEKDFKEFIPIEGEEIPSAINRIKNLRDVPYSEVIAVTKFVNDHTPFATKHSVKGEEYENVLIVIGRGWNQYNFNQMLEWFKNGVPNDKTDTFERSRNLFYVACSRPQKNIAILFTQLLSLPALEQLNSWFGSNNVIGLDLSI